MARPGTEVAEAPAPAPANAVPATGQPQAAAGSKTITIIDGTSGNRREIVVPGNGNAGATEQRGSPAQRFSEPSRHGPLPKVGPDGTRPSEAFARAIKPPAGKAERAARGAGDRRARHRH